MLTLLGLVGSLWLGAAPAVQAQSIVHEFFVPMPEAQMRTALATIEPKSGTVGNTIRSIVSIVVVGEGTKVYYDQWEDGYEVDLNNPTQASTRIWGDGNNANGIAPGFVNDPVSFPAGTVLSLDSVVPLPRNAANFFFDGRDRVGGTKALVMTRTGWPETPGPVLGGSIEVSATVDYGLQFVAPVGVDVSANQMFEYTGLFIMARDNGTSVTIDVDGTGPTAAITIPLNRGESYLVNNTVKKGATVNATKPVQVHMITGDISGKYETNYMTLFPLEQWSKGYYSPVGTAANGNPAIAYLYNNENAPITVNVATKTGSTSFPIASKGVYAYTLPKSSGARFTSTAPFFGIVMVGADAAKNNVHDWGFTLVPEDSLTPELVCGWGPGSSDVSQNGSPVWVTAVANTRIYVDYNGDRDGSLTDPKGAKYDVHYDLTALEVRTLYDPDKDQTAMRVYTLDGTQIAGAWGQDPAVSGTGNPFLDVGTTILPFPVPQLKKTSALFSDTAPLNELNLGDVLEYTITIDNRGLLPLGNLNILDPLAPQLSYVPNSTTLDGNPIPDDLVGTTVFPLDESGYVIPNIPRGGQSVFTYRTTLVGLGQVTNTVSNDGFSLSSSANVAVVPGDITPPVIEFTDDVGGSKSTYLVNTDVYLTLTDANANTDETQVETIQVLVKNLDTGDLEFLTLTETGPNTGVFRNSTGLLASTTSGTVQQDGTLFVRVGDELSVQYNDAVYNLPASDNAYVVGPTLFKQLYLSGALELDRIDPVATADLTTAKTDALKVAAAGIAIDATSSGSTPANAGGGSLTFSHTTGNGSDRLMLVGISVANSSVNQSTVSTVTYASQSLTLVGSVIADAAASGTSARPRTEIWSLVNPPSGTANVVVTLNTGTRAITAGATTFTGVNQSTPLGTFASAQANTGTSASVTVSTADGQVVFDTASVGAYYGTTGSAPPTATLGADQVSRWDLSAEYATSGELYVRGSGSTWASNAASRNMTRNWTGNLPWAIGAVSVRPNVPLATISQVASTLTTWNTASATLSSFSESYNSGSTGTNRLLVVGISYRDNDDETVTAVSYGGTAMTQIGTANTGNDGTIYLYRMVNPPTGSNTLAITWNSSLNNGAVIGAVTYEGVDPTQPTGTFASATSTGSTTPAVNVVSQSGDLVIGLVAGRTTSAYTITGGGSSLWSILRTSNQTSGSAQTRAGGGTVNVSWSGTNDEWAAGGVALKPAPAPTVVENSATFTQTPNFQKDFSLPLGGELTVLTHVNVTSGTMPANPDITAELKYGATTIATLSSPVWSALNNTLTWTGAMASNLTVPSGQAITLTVSSDQAGVEFEIEYDSQSKPSVVTLPTTTVIEVDDVTIYDAPYPGGNPVPSGTNGTTLYVRTEVSDPFGAYDITGLDLAIDGPGVDGDVTTTLGALNEVSNSGAVKIYEYVWNTTLVEGNYNVGVTALEGFEDAVTDSSATSISLSTLDGGGTPATAEFTDGSNGPDAPTYPGDSQVCVRVTDLDQNLDIAAIDTINVTVSTSTGDSETFSLTETGVNTGIFTGCIAASTTGGGVDDDGTLNAPLGTVLTLSYTDPNDPTDTAGDTASVPALGDAVKVSKSLIEPANGSAKVGETLEYEITVVNTGSNPLATVQVVDTFPASLDYDSASVTPDGTTPTTLTWNNVGPLAVGASAKIKVFFTAAASDAAAVNSVAVSGTASDTTTAPPVAIVNPEVTVTKVVHSTPNDPAEIGDNVVFRITVANTGDTALASIPLEDSYSGASFEFVSATIAPDSAGFGSLLWDDLTGAGSLAPLDDIVIDVTMKVIGAAEDAPNKATADFVEDEFGNSVPSSESTATIDLIGATISGTVYDDVDESGDFTAGETGLKDVVVKLYKVTNPGDAPATGTLVGLTNTDAAGAYEFIDVGQGNYVIQQTDLAGYISTGDTEGANDGLIRLTVTTLIDYTGNDFFDAKGVPDSEIETLDVFDVTATTARITGAVNPQGLPTTACFELSTDPDMLTGVTSTDPQDVGSGTTSVDYDQELTGLIPETRYYYRAKATQDGGATFIYGEIKSFVTSFPISSAEDVDGLPVGGEIYRPMPGAINPSGRITLKFYAYLGIAGVTAADDAFVMTDSSGTLTVLGREGQNVAGLGLMRGFFENLILTPAGSSIITENFSVKGRTNTAYLITETGTPPVEIISKTNDAAPGGGSFKVLLGKPVVDADERIYFGNKRAGGGVTAKRDTGVWYDEAGSLAELVLEGEPVPGQLHASGTKVGQPNAWFGNISNDVVAGDGGMAFIANFQNNPANARDKTNAKQNMAALSVDVAAGGEPVIIARKGLTVPGGSTWLNLQAVSRGAGGDHLVLGLMARASGVTTTSDQALVAILAGTQHLVAREGTTVIPGTGNLRLNSFVDHYISATGDVVFRGFLRGALAGSDQVVCRWNKDTGLSLILRENDLLPAPLNANRAELIQRLTVSPAGNIGILVTNSNAASRNVVLRDLAGGTGLEVIEYSGRNVWYRNVEMPILTLSIFESRLPAGSTGGLGVGINDAGQMDITLDLGGTRHVVKVYD
jgi:uncharacterized repeat protein (TIGR01451 family)